MKNSDIFWNYWYISHKNEVRQFYKEAMKYFQLEMKTSL
jgi:hypothetical protein